MENFLYTSTHLGPHKCWILLIIIIIMVVNYLIVEAKLYGLSDFFSDNHAK